MRSLLFVFVSSVSSCALCLWMLQSQGGHHHHHEAPATNFSQGHHLHDEQEEDLDAVWKGLTALSGVYFMFLIEHFLTLGKMYKDKKQKVGFFLCLVIKTKMKLSELHFITHASSLF